VVEKVKVVLMCMYLWPLNAVKSILELSTVVSLVNCTMRVSNINCKGRMRGDRGH
jgi:hypothetical protein